jgi:hypothetical protein
MRIKTSIEVCHIQPIGIVLENLRKTINENINEQLCSGTTKTEILGLIADRANISKLHLLFAEKKLATAGKSAKHKVHISVCINQVYSLCVHFHLTDPGNPAQLITNQFIANILKKL